VKISLPSRLDKEMKRLTSSRFEFRSLQRSWDF